MIGVQTKVRVRIIPKMPDELSIDLFHAADYIIYLEYV